MNDASLDFVWPGADGEFRALTRANLLLEACALTAGFDTLRINRRGFLAGRAPSFDAFGFQETISSETSRAAVRACEDRVARRVLLAQAGVRVPKSRSFGFDAVHEAEAFAAEIPVAVLVKARSAEHATTRTPLKSGEEIRESLDALQDKLGFQSAYLIERLVQGREYSFYVVDKQVVSVVQRRNGAWVKEVYRAGAESFGSVHPDLLAAAVKAAAAMPAMPHATVQMFCRDIASDPKRCFVVSVSPEASIVGARPPKSWSVFMAETLVGRAALGSASERQPAGLLQLSFEMSDMADADAAAAAVSNWMTTRGIDGTASRVGRRLRGELAATPGQAATMTGTAKAQRFAGQLPQTIAIWRNA